MGVDQLVQGLGHDRVDLLDRPAGAQRLEVVPHPVHRRLVGALEEVDELREGALQDRAPVDQAALVEGTPEGEGAALGDHRLVQVEERRRTRLCPHRS